MKPRIEVACASGYDAACSCGWKYRGDDYRQIVDHDVSDHHNLCVVNHTFAAAEVEP